MPETLVLIPGLLCDEIVWEPVRKLLGQGVVADLSTQDNIPEMAADILAANSGNLAVAGHSMGARVALEMVRLAPDRIHRLALLDTGIHPATKAEEPGRARRVRLAYDQGMAVLCDDWLPPMVHASRHNDPAIMAPLRAMVLAKTPELHERQIRALLARPDPRPILPKISCPTLVLVGDEDQWSPVEQHREIARHIANARLEIVQKAGHFAPFEQSRAVANAMKLWLEDPL